MMQNFEIVASTPNMLAEQQSTVEIFVLHLEIVNFLNDDLTVNALFCG